VSVDISLDYLKLLMDHSKWIIMGQQAPHARIALNNTIKFRFYLKRVHAGLIFAFPFFLASRWIKYENLLASQKPNVTTYNVKADYATGKVLTYENVQQYKLTQL